MKNKPTLLELIYSFFVMVCLTATIVYIAYSHYHPSSNLLEGEQVQAQQELPEIWKVEK